MKHGRLRAGSWMGALIALAIPALSIAAEAQVLAQDLVNVRASTRVAAALWTRRLDSYTLQIALPYAGCGVSRATTAAAQEAAKEAAQDAAQIDRSTFFIGNTIANLRGLDPTFGNCTLVLIDGRRTAAAASPPAPSRPPEQAVPQKVVVEPAKDPPTIQVWLLRADGTQIPAVAVATEPSSAYGCKVRCPVSGKLYRFPLLEGAQAVAVAISVDDVYYIDKLQSLEPIPAAQ